MASDVAFSFRSVEKHAQQLLGRLAVCSGFGGFLTVSGTAMRGLYSESRLGIGWGSAVPSLSDDDRCFSGQL